MTDAEVEAVARRDGLTETRMPCSPEMPCCDMCAWGYREARMRAALDQARAKER